MTLNYPVILSHRRSITVSSETYPLNSMWNSVKMRETSIFEVWHSGSCFFLCNFNRTSKSRFKKRECAYKELFLPALPSQEYCLYYSQLGNLIAAQNPCHILQSPVIRTIANIKELEVVIVQIFQDGAHSDDITMR